MVARDSLVEGNYVGTDVGGTQPLGNGAVGVMVFHQADSFGNTIGGLAPGAGNVIAFNGSHGVGIGGVGTFKAGLDCEFVPSCPGAQILSNSIHDNGCLGILLARNFIGVNSLACFGGLPNDPGDTDAARTTCRTCRSSARSRSPAERRP